MSDLESTIASSPYLARLARRNPDVMRIVADGKGAEHAAAIIANMPQHAMLTAEKPLMAALRNAKADIALITALEDRRGHWPLTQVTETLSRFADAALQAVVTFLCRAAIARGHLSPAANTPPDQGIFVLAMGKHGGRELNYSSDIDIIVLFDPDRLTYRGPRSAQAFMNDLTRQLTAIMESRTPDGYVFRVDLRLRPDPHSSGLALSVTAALAYYQSLAQNWERAAYIKARPAAGDSIAAHDFLVEMAPWVWRRSIDYAALGELAALKQQAGEQAGQRDQAFDGYDVKLGRGGIREIELFAQISQLLFGGRDPDLRERATCDALNALADAGHIAPESRNKLIAAYTFLRRLEHSLQMLDDRQTHRIPTDRQAQARIATLMDMSIDALKPELALHRSNVQAIYRDLLPAERGDTDRSYPQWVQQSEAAQKLISRWRLGEVAALRSPRSRALMEHCLPDMLAAFGSAASPFEAMQRFDSFLAEIPASVQLFALLQANPALHRLLARLMAVAPGLAAMLAKRPGLWGNLVEPHFFAPIGDTADLQAQLYEWLEPARDYEDILTLTRDFVHDQQFRISIQYLEHIADIDETARAFSDLAEATLLVIIPTVERRFIQQYGECTKSGLVVLALGKLGGRGMTLTSDLDLVFLYDSPAGAESSGSPAMSASRYFSRLVQQIITAVTALTPGGRLYEVDTRLRPFGRQGPLVVHRDSFAAYYRDNAWSWEYLALTRYRLLYARGVETERLEADVRSALSHPRTAARLGRDIADMRRKMLADMPPASAWDIKRLPGGLIDVEFIIQTLQLVYAQAEPECIQPALENSLAALAAGGYIRAEQAKILNRALQLYSRLQSVFRLTIGHAPRTEGDISAGLAELICEALDCHDLEQVADHVRSISAEIRGLFDLLVASQTPIYHTPQTTGR